jgi:hypothetical protein
MMQRRDVEFVRPLEVSFRLREEECTVRPANVGQCVDMLVAVQPLIEELVTLPQGFWQRLFSADNEATGLDLAELVHLLARRGNDALSLVAIAHPALPVARLRELNADEFLYLFTVVMEVNHDFFGQAARSIEEAAAKLKALAVPASGPGATPGQPPSQS